MKILWASNAPWVPTGYGNQTQLFCSRIRDLGHEVAIHGFFGLHGSTIQFDGMRVYPCYLDEYGNDIVGRHAKHFGADVVVTLYDAWVLDPNAFGDVPWLAWAPVDTEPLAARVRERLKMALLPIAYSQDGKRKMENAGLAPAYIPHGVDTKAFAPISKQEARVALGWNRYNDRFVVGMVAANKGHTPSRKAFPEQIEAFARFQKKRPEALLYLHTTLAQHGEFGGVNILSLCEHHGLKPGRDVGWADQYGLAIGFSTDHMRNVYGAMDVLLSVSMGEGFGIPILEAQSCGRPVIVGDWSAMGELCFAGWKVPQDESHRVWLPFEAWQRLPRVGAIERCLQMAYNAADSDALMGKARESAMDYDADVVTERHWKPVLAEVEARLADVPLPTEIAGPLKAA